MIRPRVGLLVFSESLVREDVYRKRKPISDREVARLISSLGDRVEIIRPENSELRSKQQVLAAVHELTVKEAELALLYVPIFVAPALVAHCANLLHIPLVLAGNEAPDSLSQLAFLASAGAMDQSGIRYTRIPGDLAREPNCSLFVQCSRAAAARQRLRGQTFGSIGGRSLGISTGTTDPAGWQKLFGVDIEHIDQFEIVRRAPLVDEEAVTRQVQWLRKHANVCFNESNFTPAHLDRQVRSYLATRQIARSYELSFIGIKCQPEMSNHFCLQCLNVSLCNDPYDGDGPKEPLVCSCEADADGALTMQILKLISGGSPTNLNDIASIDEHEMTLANCGAMATWYAALSPDPAENLAAVNLIPHSFGEAGGAATQFTVPAGIEMTFARLFRRESAYILGVMSGRTVTRDRQCQAATIQTRPLIFAELHIDKPLFLQTFGSNHIHGVVGKFKGELATFARLAGIQLIDYDKTATAATAAESLMLQ